VSQYLSQYLKTMVTTQWRGRDLRTDRWLARYGSDLPAVSEEAWSLLSVRLAAVRQTRWPLVVAGGFGVPMFAWGSIALFSDAPDSHETYARWFVATIVVLQIGGLAAQALARRADARIAASLPQRVARGAHVRLSDVLGRRALIASSVSLALALGWCTLLFALGAVRLATALLTWFLLAGTACALAVRAAATRPTVACDACSLTIDERLRSQEALRPVGVLTSLWISASMASQTTSAQGLPGYAPTGLYLTVILVSALQVVALTPRRWPAPPPATGPTAPARPEP
jgi:hypothetical protein